MSQLFNVAQNSRNISQYRKQMVEHTPVSFRPDPFHALFDPPSRSEYSLFPTLLTASNASQNKHMKPNTILPLVDESLLTARYQDAYPSHRPS